MAIREDTGALLGIREILSDLGSDEFATTDMIGLGLIIGATDGVVGSGDNVILPTDFWGQEVNLTATTATIQSSYAFANTGGDVSISATINGIFRIGNIPSWLSVTPVYGNGNTTFSFRAADNSFLGATAHPSQAVQIIGYNDTVLDTISVSQAGNPVTLQFSTNSPSGDYTAGTVSLSLTAGTNFDGQLTVASSNESLATVSLGSHNSADPRVYPVTITKFLRYNTSNDSCTISVTGVIGNGSITRNITFTQTSYDTVRWSTDSIDDLSDNGGTQTVTLAGASAIPYQGATGGHDWTVTADDTYSWISFSPSTGNYRANGERFDPSDVGDNSVTFTFSANSTDSPNRTASFTIEDDTSGLTDVLSVTQSIQELSEFDIDSNDTDAHILELPENPGLLTDDKFSLTVTANTGFNDDWEIQGIVSSGNQGIEVGPSGTTYYHTGYLEHKVNPDGTWTPITTALTGTGNADIYVRNPNGQWLSFATDMLFPLYRFRSQSYPSDYSQYVSITQPKKEVRYSLSWDGTTPNTTSNALCCGSSVLVVNANTNTEAIVVGFSTAVSVDLEIKRSDQLNYTSWTGGYTTGTSTSHWTSSPGGGYDLSLDINSLGNTTPLTNQFGTLTVRQQSDTSNTVSFSPFYVCSDSTSCGGGGGGGFE